MRNQKINQTPILYLNFVKVEKVKDSDGYYTGETKNTYTPTKKVMGHISGAKGSSQVEVFGTEIDYDKTLLITKSKFKETGITENSVFFIEKKPSYENGQPNYDYRVKKIAETINEVAIAIKKVSD